MRWTSTRDSTLAATFLEAARRSVPGDGGLFVPAALAPLAGLDELLALPRRERAERLFAALLGGEIGRVAVTAFVRAAFPFDVPLVAVAPGQVRARALPRSIALVQGLRRRLPGADPPGETWARGPRTVLTATSGDTGAAVAQRFTARRGFASPCSTRAAGSRRRRSGRSRRSAATSAPSRSRARSTTASGWSSGPSPIPASCAPPAWSPPTRSTRRASWPRSSTTSTRRRSSRGSILRRRAPVVAVPSGNFGNLCAGVIARRLGAPIARLRARDQRQPRPCPSTWTAPPTGRAPSVATLSNAMDVGAPNNWERLVWLHGGEVERIRARARLGERRRRGDPRRARAPRGRSATAPTRTAR